MPQDHRARVRRKNLTKRIHIPYHYYIYISKNMSTAMPINSKFNDGKTQVRLSARNLIRVFFPEINMNPSF